METIVLMAAAVTTRSLADQAMIPSPLALVMTALSAATALTRLFSRTT
jgi:hypothetical protein